jgi:hypothetical protein
MTFKELVKAMKSCEQTQGLNVLQHGLSVNQYFQDLKAHIIDGTPLKFEWKLPGWIYNKDIWNNLASDKDINTYQIYHDCGKPFCLTIDEEGKRHFPDHAKVSGQIWRQIGGSEIQASLMEHDMDIHLLKMEDFEEFRKLPFAETLLITGLCEIHSNAAMFGGIDSTSFKIKWKKINKIGKRFETQEAS